MFKLLIVLTACFQYHSAFAQFSTDQAHAQSLNFSAPTVNGNPLATDNPVGSIVFDLSTHGFRGLFDNGSWGSITQGSVTAPSIQKFTSGSGTYTTPTGVLYLRVRMAGGGGGGSGSGSASYGTGGNGGNSTFGSSFLTAYIS
jgi:hypothetical protein